MNELDNLRPEVREAVEKMDTADITLAEDDQWQIARAELLRLAKIEEERWAVVATRNGALERAEKAEAELAALKARIAGSWMCRVSNDTAHGEFGSAIYGLPSEFRGKLVQLLVED